MRHCVHGLFCVLFLGLTAMPQPAVASRPQDPSPFVGDYSGLYTTGSSHPLFPNMTKGTFNLSIDDNGMITGKGYNQTQDEAFDLSGSVSEDGAIKLTVEFSNAAFVLKGTVTKTHKGHLRGTVEQYFGTNEPVGNVDFDLPPV